MPACAAICSSLKADSAVLCWWSWYRSCPSASRREESLSFQVFVRKTREIVADQLRGWCRERLRRVVESVARRRARGRYFKSKAQVSRLMSKPIHAQQEGPSTRLQETALSGSTEAIVVCFPLKRAKLKKPLMARRHACCDITVLRCSLHTDNYILISCVSVHASRSRAIFREAMLCCS